MDYAQSVTIVLVFVLLLLVWSYKPTRQWLTEPWPQEHFDTYYNHDMGAQTVYRFDNTPDATLRAKYTWKETDPRTGMNVYDHYYEAHLAEIGYSDAYLETAAFPASEMKRDKWPATVFNGEVITLAQKNY